jgi:death on curing protein
MVDIIFLTLEEVLTLHDDAISFAGGETGVLSIDMLQSAIAQPEAGFGDQRANPFPFGMAAAYAFHLTRNHAHQRSRRASGSMPWHQTWRLLQAPERLGHDASGVGWRT